MISGQNANNVSSDDLRRFMEGQSKINNDILSGMLTIAKFTKQAFELFSQIHIKFSTFGYGLDESVQTLDETIKKIEMHSKSLS